MRSGSAELIALHAKLRAEVGHDGCGGADGEEGRGERGEGRGISGKWLVASGE